MPDLGDRLAAATSRGITRRKMLRRSAEAAVATGILVSSPFTFFQRKAAASTCSVYGQVGTFGCNCASDTSTCAAGSCSSGNCVSPARKRCNYWTTGESGSGNFCWCSLTCCHGGFERAYYTCCDCWAGGSGACGSGTNPCVCKQYTPVGAC